MRHKGCYWGPILILFVATSANLAIAQDVTVNGNLLMSDSTSTVGNVLKDGDLFIHNFGTDNTFTGKNAGNLFMTGSSNTASGVSALLSNTTGFSNTASGAFALRNNTTGAANTASGVLALSSNTTGFSNTATGVGALSSNTTGRDNTASGVNGLQNNTTGSNNTAYGFMALWFNDAGFNNTASGVNALQNNTTGSNNTAVGFSADVLADDLSNATAIGAGAIVDASNKIRLGNSDVEVIEGQVPYTFTSDRNQKENFRPVDGEQALRRIGGLNLTSWNYIGHDPQKFRHYGPVAQEFFAAFGHDAVGTIGTPTTINSGDMEGILMIAVQALEKRTAELATLKAENADLKARLERLERSIGTLVVKAE